MVSPPAEEARTRRFFVLWVIVVVLLALQGVLLAIIAETFFHGAGEISDAFDDFQDARIDSGLDDPPFSADEPLLRQRKVLLFHDVNSRTAKDVSGRLMYLDGLDHRAPIDLYISTQGGWEDNAFTIIDTMRMIAAPVNTWAVGGCYSAGALILAAGTGRRYATEDALLMIHTNSVDSEEPWSFDHLAKERYERVYRTTTSLPEEWYPMTDDEKRYLGPEEALKFRVIDEVVEVWKAPRGQTLGR